MTVGGNCNSSQTNLVSYANCLKTIIQDGQTAAVLIHSGGFEEVSSVSESTSTVIRMSTSSLNIISSSLSAISITDSVSSTTEIVAAISGTVTVIQSYISLFVQVASIGGESGSFYVEVNLEIFEVLNKVYIANEQMAENINLRMLQTSSNFYDTISTFNKVINLVFEFGTQYLLNNDHFGITSNSTIAQSRFSIQTYTMKNLQTQTHMQNDANLNRISNFDFSECMPNLLASYQINDITLQSIGIITTQNDSARNETLLFSYKLSWLFYNAKEALFRDLSIIATRHQAVLLRIYQ